MKIPDNWIKYDVDDNKYKVYCLTHPINNNILYIGCTKNNLFLRIRQHFMWHKENSEKDIFFKQMRREGVYPNIAIIYKFDDKESALFIEKLLINFVREFVNPEILNACNVPESDTETDEFLSQIRSQIIKMGLMKFWVANRIGIDKVRFSQSLNKKRRFTDEEVTKVKKLLSI